VRRGRGPKDLTCIVARGRKEGRKEGVMEGSREEQAHKKREAHKN
jgi:hypothetical protein